jgi:hypothetical protein
MLYYFHGPLALDGVSFKHRLVMPSKPFDIQ